MILPPNDEPGQNLTDQILLIAAGLIAQSETPNLEPIFRGIVCAYVSLALYAGGRDYAKKMLQGMIDILDDPTKQDAIYRGLEGWKGGNA